ncbi:hypothetical protein ABXS75_04585 [Roseburia hominis]
MKEKSTIKLGSIKGYLITLGIGFGLYFLTKNLPSLTNKMAYGDIASGVLDHTFYKFCWFFMDFTEATFFASVCASLFMIIGGALAWRMAVHGSKKQVFPICYGMSSMWPWVLAGQCLSLILTLFVFGYINLFKEAMWIPSFLVTVSTPNAVLLLYGPSVSALLTGSILTALICAPLATWCINTIVPLLQLPAGYGGLMTMALMAFLVCSVCKYLPWMKQKAAKQYPAPESQVDLYSAQWAVRRTFADFTEPMFYGNDVAGAMMVLGVLVDYLINHDHVANGAGALLPAILLSQFVASGTGVFLYTSKYEEYGWVGTFIPVVSAAPFCVLTHGGSIGVAVLAGVIGGVFCAPVGHLISERVPKGIHPFFAGVLTMLLVTPVTLAVTGIFF